jgi:phosphohistidine phosphatase
MLFLVHHADAVDAIVDPQRPLSESGRSHAERLAGRAQQRGVKPDVVWHSGKLRARQTAEFYWRACNPLAELSAIRNLQSGDPPEWIRDDVEADPRTIMLVGHIPNIPRLLELLVRPTGIYNAFPVHGIVALNREEKGWIELWRDE